MNPNQQNQKKQPDVRTQGGNDPSRQNQPGQPPKPDDKSKYGRDSKYASPRPNEDENAQRRGR